MPDLLDAPTLSLIRRVLCAHAPPTQPLSSLLPPITKHPDIDMQLYALLAIVCRDYIDTWYTGISSDREFISEVVKVVADVVAEVERRVDGIDIPLLLLDELPALVTRHITDHRLAHARAGTVSHHTPAELFHNLQPHPALASAEATQQYNKLLSHALLDALLPVQKLQSPCARTFVRDLLAAMAVGGLVEKMSEPAMLHGLITSLLARPPSPPPPPPPAAPPPPPPPPEPRPLHHQQARAKTPSIRIPPALESALSAMLLLLLGFKAFAVSLLHTLHTPPPPPPRPPRAKKPFLAMAAVRLLPVYLGVPLLQPWLWGILCLLLRPLTTGRIGAAVDGLIADAVTGGLESSVVAEALWRARGLLFPGNAPMGAGGAPVDVAAVRRRAVDVLVERVPEAVWGVWVGEDGDKEGRRRWVGEWCVDVWGDKEVNRHLWYAVLDLLVGRLVPELVEGPSVVKGKEG
ncbi:uncharacterized protein H6S33_002981 [Morchella sextelata]|uniref:uncharacterized protein n=1 Tax=Morchella sextelata TaxID=1174677 RepID=UPI001D04AB77|nr:uncharacterized protein H6S33_002981 [Morchella sextelata]KAH0606993.1 hypothetical protein H6S33_002981 [Morchella sextelata]